MTDRNTPSAIERIDDLVLDRIDALRVLRATTPDEKGAILEQIAGEGRVEQDIVRDLSKMKPLWRPDRFEEAHTWPCGRSRYSIATARGPHSCHGSGL